MILPEAASMSKILSVSSVASCEKFVFVLFVSFCEIFVKTFFAEVLASIAQGAGECHRIIQFFG
jgi:hypothetical protein